MQFAIKFTDATGVASLYVASVVAKYPTSATVPADASADVKASIARIEAMLGGKTIVMVTADGTTPEGQMIEGQMIEGQMIEGQMIEGQMIDSADGD
jgi:hypothetical protein